jgi:hypothetical protein
VSGRARPGVDDDGDMRVRRLTAGIAAALLLSLGACGGDDATHPYPYPFPSRPTATESPGPSRAHAPTPPPRARGTDEAAARAFVRFYLEVVSEAMSTGRTRPIRRHGTPSCASCATVAATVDDLYEDGATWDTGGWEPLAFTSSTQVPHGYGFEVRVRQHRRLIREGGRLVGSTPAADLSMRIEVHRSDGRWRTAELVILR